MSIATIPPNVSIGERLIGVATTFFAVALAFSSSRFFVRLKSGNFGRDDYFLIASVVASIGLYTCYIVGVLHGIGRHIEYVSPSDITIVLRTRMWISLFYVWTSGFLKLSLATTLLKFYEKRGWRLIIYTLMLYQLAITLASLLIELLRCQPLRAAWDLNYPRSSCLGELSYQKWLYALYGTFLITDIIYSVLPIPFLVKSQLKKRDKVILCFLMGLGLIASAATIPKLISLGRLTSLRDITWIIANFAMWTVTEMYCGIIAASIPTLRSLFESGLRKCGVVTVGRAQHLPENGSIVNTARNTSSTQSRTCNEIDTLEPGCQQVSFSKQGLDTDTLHYSRSQKSSRDLEKGIAAFPEHENEKDWLVVAKTDARGSV